MNNQITYKQIIAAVRSRLEGGQERIADVPCPFRETWWPETPDFQTQLSSDMGVQPSSELKKWIYEVFSEEVKAIRESLKDTGYEPELAEWQKGSTRAARNLWASTNIQTDALGFWEEIAIPVRRRSDLIFHILAPRDVMGAPIVQILHVDDYIRGVSRKTSEDKLRIARMEKKLGNWKLISFAIGIVTLILVVVAW